MAPYPGLRAFREDEAEIFFGRDSHIRELLIKLEKSRFLMVTGPSGCGKSSLVRTGLLSALKSGFMASAGSRWQIVDLFPGNDPLWNLADGLHYSFKRAGNENGSKFRDHIREIAGWHPMLTEELDGFRKVLTEAGFDPRVNLLILVDQFEEIFRMYGLGQDRDSMDSLQGEDEKFSAKQFVKLLLQIAQQQELPIFVLLTMRTGYLEHCFAFKGLPEEINKSLYLTPILTEEEMREAVSGPAAVCQGKVSEDLMDFLMSETHNEPDDLPLLQHTLMQVWNFSNKRVKSSGSTLVMTMEDCENVGGGHNALDLHAEEVYEELGKPNSLLAKIAEIMFRELTELRPGILGLKAQDVRRPCQLGKIADVAGLTAEELPLLCDVVDAFRSSTRNFITTRTKYSSGGEAPQVNDNEIKNGLTRETILDISHESLIRQWKRLGNWAKDEARKAEKFKNLVKEAKYYKNKNAYLDDVKTKDYVTWRNENNPTQGWAKKYEPEFGDFHMAMKFLNACELHQKELRQNAENDRQQELKNARIKYYAALLGAIVVTAFLFWVLKLKSDADNQTKRATEQEQIALSNQYAFASMEALNNDPELSIKLGLIAHSKGTKNEISHRNLSLNALQRAVQSSRMKRSFSPYDGKEKKRLFTVSFDKQGKQVLAAGEAKEVVFWDADTGVREKFTLRGAQHQDSIRAAAYSPDGKYIATGSKDLTAKIWDRKTGELVKTLKGHNGYIIDISFSPDNNTLATASVDKTVKLWKLSKNHENYKTLSHEDQVVGVTFSPDSMRLATITIKGIVKLWDLKTGKGVTPFFHHSENDPKWCCAFAIAWSPSGRYLATGGDDEIGKIWDLDSHDVRLLRGHTGSIKAIAFSPDNQYLATASDDRSAIIWEVETGYAEIFLKKHNSPLTGISYNWDGTRLATTSEDGTVKIWDVARKKMDFKMVEKFPDNIFNIDMDLEHNYLAILSKDGLDAQLRNTKKDMNLILKLNENSQNPTTALAVSPDGRKVATAILNKGIQIWDIETESKTLSIAESQVFIKALAISHDGKKLVTGSVTGGKNDIATKLWDLSNGKKIRGFGDEKGTVNAVAISSNGKWVATASHDVTIWDSETGQKLRTLGNHYEKHDNAVLAVSFSPEKDSPLLATSGQDRSVKVWDFNKNKLLWNFQQDLNDFPRKLFFSKNGKWLSAFSGDWVEKRYPLDYDELVKKAEASSVRNLTLQECELYPYFSREQCNDSEIQKYLGIPLR